MFGLSQEWLLYNGRPIASALVLGHESELARLRALTPAAAGIGVVAGDPAFDRMLVSRHLRMHYRQALDVAPHQKLIVVCTTWSDRSLLGTWPTLFRELTACLPRDEYRIVGLVHPNVWHGHGTLQVNTWLDDARRAGLTLIGPTEGWQAVLLAADLIVGDHGATTCYGAAEDLPVLLGTFPDSDVAPGSVGELLGALATRLNRHETLRTQIEYAMQRHRPGHFAPIRDLMTSCPGEAIERLRALCYRHMRLSVPATAPVTPVIPPELIAIDRPAVLADHVTCTPTGPAEYTIERYPAGVDIDRATAGYLDRAFLVVHENHSQQSLLREAPVVLATAPAAGQDADEVLADVLRRWAAAQVVGVEDADGQLVLTRRGHRISICGNDTGLAAAVVYEWLLTGVGELPSELGVIVGARRETFVLRRSRDQTP
ncbi:hypothetical protein [Nocardia terpenica]|uniref:hypothetical protein n=1 Tax=Nocardia terpenica TaxID=455432 RepID=UPI001EE9B8E1|nr:hypothetical protein [Nocardia terpenica]